MEGTPTDGLRSEMSEMMLLGHIVNNIDLVADYQQQLKEEDFTNPYYPAFWKFLKEYYRHFEGAPLEAEKMSALYVHLTEDEVLFLPHDYGREPSLIFTEFAPFGAAVDADNDAYRTVKKLSLLRKLDYAEFPIDDICARSDFAELTADDVLALMLDKVDEVAGDMILRGQEELGKNMRERALQFLEEPEKGLQTPFNFINDYLHGLVKSDFTLIGGISNSGKGRVLLFILTWLVVHEGQKVCLMSNEMTGNDFFKALLCTLVNMHQAHGITVSLTQREIVQGLYTDADGNLIVRQEGESIAEYDLRLIQSSQKYRDCVAVQEWWKANFEDKFLFINVSDDYSNERLKHEIRQAKKQGCTVIAYDTLKSYQSTEWGDLVQAATELSELIRNDKDGLVGLATFQLTDDVVISSPEDLSSMKIARAKGIMHLADHMLMFMHLNEEQKKKYNIRTIIENDGKVEELTETIPEGVRITAFKIVKNRRDDGKDMLFAVQSNLDYNCWYEVGELVRKPGQQKAG